MNFPNVLITGHQAFFTREALEQITTTTLNNLTDFEKGVAVANEVPHPPAPSPQAERGF
jgi:D-lactate dehydrogenase